MPRDRDKYNAYARGWYRRNRKRMLKKARLYRKRNGEMVRAKRRAYHARNKELVASQTRARRERNPSFYLLGVARSRARKLNIPFSITLADVVIPKKCPIFGIPLRLGKVRLSRNSPSLDRINPAKGYVKGNVAVISHWANLVKSDATAAQHRRIADWMEKFVAF